MSGSAKPSPNSGLNPGPDQCALQDDLAQLERLLKEAISKLSADFVGAHDALASLSRLQVPGAANASAQRALTRSACDHLDSALTALQFEDIASQLIASARHHLGGGGERSADAVNRSVPQQHMESGGIELF